MVDRPGFRTRVGLARPQQNRHMLKPMLFFTLADVGLIWLLIRYVPPDRFRRLGGTLVAASALFWGVFAIALIGIYWSDYYSHFVPAWAWWLTPTTFLTYSLIGAFLYWLALQLPGNPLLNFILLGGLESVPEHLLGIYGFKILEVVPMLQGFSPQSILVFATFEYVLYWGLVVLLAVVLQRARQWWNHLGRPRAV